MCLIPITLFIYQKLKPADVIAAEANLLFTPEELLELGFRSPANDVAKYVEADRNFHLAVIEITGNKRLLEAVSTLRSQARLFGLQRIADKGGLQSSSEEHNQLMNAIERHDSTRAEEIMREHLGHIREEWS